MINNQGRIRYSMVQTAPKIIDGNHTQKELTGISQWATAQVERRHFNKSNPQNPSSSPSTPRRTGRGCSRTS